MTVVVSDTSPLHYLILCKVQEALAVLFTQVLIPPTVLRELHHPHAPPEVRSWSQRLPNWVEIQPPSHLNTTLDLDRGELEAISLAQEIQADAILVDDRLARIAARRCGLIVTGTIGVLERAAELGLIDLPEVIARLQRTNVRLDPELIQGVLARYRKRRHPGEEP